MTMRRRGLNFSQSRTALLNRKSIFCGNSPRSVDQGQFRLHNELVRFLRQSKNSLLRMRQDILQTFVVVGETIAAEGSIVLE